MYTRPDSSCAGTRNISDRAFVPHKTLISDRFLCRGDTALFRSLKGL